MKTLLLTLVVVTSLCLDLGYTIKCYNTPLPFIYKTCPEGEKMCFEKSFKIGKFKLYVSRGCTDKCPKGKAVKCCETNKCNK
uniref:Three-finger toxin n=1 Tax=Calliophis bivirgatus TaxID=8633 RepID=A0A898ILP2_CALBG|nr:three-finger toxin [Calliophis bivirgatus]